MDLVKDLNKNRECLIIVKKECLISPVFAVSYVLVRFYSITVFFVFFL